jgi:hypothetical protein
MIYRDYPIYDALNFLSFPINTFVNLCAAIRQGISKVSFFRSLISGLVLAARQLIMGICSWYFDKPIQELPLGYEGLFSNEYRAAFGLSDSESLIHFAISQRNLFKAKKHHSEPYFSGQRGNFDRQLMLAEAMSVGINLDRIHKKFAAADYPLGRKAATLNYINGIISSKFSICPPGNYSSQTFRFLESLLLWTFPLQKKYVLSDPLRKINAKLFWRDFLRLRAQKSDFNSEELESWIEKSLHQYKSKLNEVKVVIGRA